jgi:hypothetical protein
MAGASINRTAERGKWRDRHGHPLPAIGGAPSHDAEDVAVTIVGLLGRCPALGLSRTVPL